MSSRAFTLTELIIVIVLVAILSLFVVPKLFNNSYKRQIDVIKFITNVRYTQHESMMRGGGYFIAFGSNYYYVGSPKGELLVPGEKTKKIYVQKSISATEDGEIIKKVLFDYLGEPCKNSSTLFENKIDITIDGLSVVITPFAGGVYERR